MVVSASLAWIVVTASPIVGGSVSRCPCGNQFYLEMERMTDKWDKPADAEEDIDVENDGDSVDGFFARA